MASDSRAEESGRRLVQAAAAGDREAIEALLVRHLPDLRAYVRLRAGGHVRGRENESDIVQSAAREVLERAGNFRFAESGAGEGAFKAWLYTTAVRKILNKDAFYTAQRRDVRREEDAGEESDLLATYHRFAPPSGALQSAEELERIEAAFAQLSDTHREIVLMSKVLGLSRAEVAEKTGLSEPAVRNRLHRALAKLGEILGS